MTNQGHEQFSRVGDEKMHKNKHAHEPYTLCIKNVLTAFIYLHVPVSVC